MPEVTSNSFDASTGTPEYRPDSLVESASVEPSAVRVAMDSFLFAATAVRPSAYTDCHDWVEDCPNGMSSG